MEADGCCVEHTIQPSFVLEKYLWEIGMRYRMENISVNFFDVEIGSFTG